LAAFASACLANGSDCALKAFNFTSPSALLRKIDDTIDSLYNEPVPVFGLGHPAAATAALMRITLTNLIWIPAIWSQSASWLADAFKGNFTSLVAAYDPWVSPSDAGQPDNGGYAWYSIFVCIINSCPSAPCAYCSSHSLQCGDAKPYSTSHPPPSNAAIVNEVLSRLTTYSPSTSEVLYQTAFCKLFDQAGLYPRRSRYGGSFGLANGTLHTPVLLLS
jgi:hypothetical protein